MSKQIVKRGRPTGEMSQSAKATMLKKREQTLAVKARAIARGLPIEPSGKAGRPKGKMNDAARRAMLAKRAKTMSSKSASPEVAPSRSSQPKAVIRRSSQRIAEQKLYWNLPSTRRAPVARNAQKKQKRMTKLRAPPPLTYWERPSTRATPMSRRGGRHVMFVLTPNQPTSPYCERILTRDGWQDPWGNLLLLATVAEQIEAQSSEVYELPAETEYDEVPESATPWWQSAVDALRGLALPY